MADTEDNPLFGVHLSSLNIDSSDASSIKDDAPLVAPPSTTILQIVNIKSHVLVVLDLVELNYDEYCCFFDSLIEKFGLESHLSSPPTLAQRCDVDWSLHD